MELKMRTKLLAGLLAAAALIGSVAGVEAKVITLRVRSGSASPQITSSTFAGNTDTVAQANTINNVAYTASGTFNEATNNISLDIATLSTNQTNLVKSVQYALTVTGITPQPSIMSYQDVFSGLNPVSLGGNTVSDAFVRVYYDLHNVAFGTQNLVYDSGVLSAGGCGVPPAYSCTASGSLPTVGSPYSLTEILTIDYKQGSQGLTVNSSNAFAAVPEPTSLAMLGSGLLLAGWMFRRRGNKKS
jgi:hypothetical protein